MTRERDLNNRGSESVTRLAQAKHPGDCRDSDAPIGVAGTEKHPHGDVDGDEGLAAQRRDANGLIAGGIALGAFGVATTALLGATCPLCWLAAPSLIGVGAYQRWRCRRNS